MAGINVGDLPPNFLARSPAHGAPPRMLNSCPFRLRCLPCEATMEPVRVLGLVLSLFGVLRDCSVQAGHRLLQL